MLKRAFSIADRNEQSLVDPPSYGEAVRGSANPSASTTTAAPLRTDHQTSVQSWQSSSQANAAAAGPADGLAFRNGQWQHRQHQQGQPGNMVSAGLAGAVHQPVASTSNAASPGRSAAAFVPDDKGAPSSPRASRASSTRSRRHGRNGSLDTDRDGAAPERNLRPWSPVIPLEAQKAIADLQLATDNKPLTGIYSIECNTAVARAENGVNRAASSVCPTATFTAANKGDIDITLYFRPSEEDDGIQRDVAPPLPARSHGVNTPAFPPASPLDIPLAIMLKLNKGKARLVIPDRIPWRPLRIICVLESNAHISLPVGFLGKLAIWAPQGNIELSEPLRLNSTIVPSTQNNAFITVYFIQPDESRPDTCPSHPTVAKTIDLCQVNTSKGRVRVDYAKPVRRSKSNNKDGGCHVM